MIQLQPQTITQISQQLLQSPSFISSIINRLTHPASSLQQNIETLIQNIADLISEIIHQKLQKEMEHLIADNNAILEQIRNNMEKKSSFESSMPAHRNSDFQFTEIHNLISQEKRKMLEQLGETEAERSISISMVGQYDDIKEKLHELTKKVKAMEDKYETNLKSLWNVLSMTESAVFDFMKDGNKDKSKNKDKEASSEKKIILNGSGKELNDAEKSKNQGIFSFWK